MPIKPRIVIFGASQGGISAYHYFKKHFEIVAFADNDVKKHGQILLGKPVVSAKVLNTLKLDKIIIASLYALQIHRQLVHEEGIASSVITRLPASFFEKAHPQYYVAGITVATVWIVLVVTLIVSLSYWL
jgi:FlaA1/EpsC-like NDP-sugar epimerase